MFYDNLMITSMFRRSTTFVLLESRFPNFCIQTHRNFTSDASYGFLTDVTAYLSTHFFAACTSFLTRYFRRVGLDVGTHAGEGVANDAGFKTLRACAEKQREELRKKEE